MGKAFAAASTDPQQVRAWWTKWPNANIGIATGQASGIVVVDCDGPTGLAYLASIKQGRPLPATLTAKSGRADGGVHLYYAANIPTPTNSGNGLDIRGDGGLVVAPPSRHASGQTYAWLEQVPLAPLPAWLLDWFQARPGAARTAPVLALGDRPEWLTHKSTVARRAALALAGTAAPLADIEAALALLPNPDLGWDAWNRVGMAVYGAAAGSDAALPAFLAWSAKSAKHDPNAAADRWRHYASSPPDNIGFGTLLFEARQVEPGWEPPSRKEALKQDDSGIFSSPVNGHHVLPDNLLEDTALTPLIKLNERYAVIGDVGGKCLVLSWVRSKVDDTVKIPSFQAFKSFSERYANRYITVKSENSRGETIEEPKQIGAYWLKWHRRKSFEGIDLVPNGPALLPGDYLNLWSGFAVAPQPGIWEKMKAHVAHILAAGDPASAAYILKFAAWAVQNPGERAESALVFKGGKGSGKGSFANALKRIFGQHGLQIFNSKHLVGAFNGHLRNCLLLFADEAFWAGDKQGESVLKGMLTEPALMIEQKGIDAAPWKNRLHVIMAANAEWVVPASHDERRFAVFDVDNSRIGDSAYFAALHAELRNGGLAAMLHDLLNVKLGDWHPRQGIQTHGLRRQKERSMDPRHEFWESVLQDARLPANEADEISASALLSIARDAVPKLKELSGNALGRFLRDFGCEPVHRSAGNFWRLPEIKSARAIWNRKFGAWDWRQEVEQWNEKRV